MNDNFKKKNSLTFEKKRPHVFKKGLNWDFFVPEEPLVARKTFCKKILTFFFRLSMYLSCCKTKTSYIEQVLRYNVLKKVPCWRGGGGNNHSQCEMQKMRLRLFWLTLTWVGICSGMVKSWLLRCFFNFPNSFYICHVKILYERIILYSSCIVSWYAYDYLMISISTPKAQRKIWNFEKKHEKIKKIKKKMFFRTCATCAVLPVHYTKECWKNISIFILYQNISYVYTYFRPFIWDNASICARQAH